MGFLGSIVGLASSLMSAFGQSGAGAQMGGGGAAGGGAAVAPVASQVGPSTVTPGGVTVEDYQTSPGAAGEQQGEPAEQVGGTGGGTYAPPAAGSSLSVKPAEQDQTTGSM